MAGTLGNYLEAKLAPVLVRRAAAMQAELEAQSRAIVGDMRAHHPWANRTSIAERALFAEVSSVSAAGVTTYTLRAGHGLAYGAKLERDFAGRYAIVGPTVHRYTRLVLLAVAAKRAQEH